ncbi:hypothetical protein P280DRAFT_312044 [Massarina eburnea CBS 473.64]|uniref:DUF7730 domain-containing protein n=1 Tax=Massarina eburnea CBS 473.64 TaxID=1395130 RepID=A0A6A6S2R5_9PLEO|nr:hypothetical protein P280DRAFT_312044 [Massarina eburnea CBS 473.64]
MTKAMAASSPILSLPEPIRHKIYKFILFKKETIPIARPRHAPKSNHLAICRTNSRIYSEALPIFYKHHIFTATDLTRTASILKKSPAALKYMRHLAIRFTELFSEVPDQVIYGTHSELRALCKLLGKRASLTTLLLDIRSKDLLDHDELILGFIRTQNGELPPWIKHLSPIKDLSRLYIQWTRGPVTQLSTVRKAGETMCARMVKDGAKIDDACVDVRIRRRHVLAKNEAGQEIRRRERRLELRMLVETSGKKDLSGTTVRRVRVIPYSWCTACGHFENSSSDCHQAGTMYRGCRSQVASILQLDSDPKAETWAGEPVPTEVEIWNSMKWGGKPLGEYLPEGVTEEEFEKARDWAKEGHELLLMGDKVEGDYAESDFGDTDSLVSFHG